MAFTLFKGTFTPTLGIPDGDSCRFIPDNQGNLFKLKSNGSRVKINRNNGSINLRYEGIDTLEKSAIKPYAENSTAKNLELLGINSGVTQTRGAILSKQLDPHGRIISFVFSSELDSYADGSDIFLDEELLKTSVNFKLLETGFAYPLFYDTLFYDLRECLKEAYFTAKNNQVGIIEYDKTNIGVEWFGSQSLATIAPIFPKLWRRLDNYTKDREFNEVHNELEYFKDFLEKSNDRVLIISKAQKTGLANLVHIDGNMLRLTENVENLMFDS